MRYHGFSTRDYLILEQLPLNKDLSFLEIGVGLGGVVDMIIGKVKEYCGVDIAREVINYLASLYKHNDSVSWYCLDVCRNSSLNKKFDVVFSVDTLEHVDSPAGYFNFIKKHLKPTGVALVIFPNDSKEEHHGITRFDNKKDLLEIINKANLKIITFSEVKETFWHRTIRNFLWEFPKSIILKKNNKFPQTFEQTEAFKIARTTGIKTNVFTFYASMVTRLAAIIPPYNIEPLEEKSIVNKRLFIRLKHK